MAIPQILITLSPAGGLQAELPGVNGMRRVVSLDPGSIHSTLVRMLAGQQRSAVEIGLDGSPTQRQVDHWEKHADWPSDRCPWCRAEGLVPRSSQRPIRTNVLLKRDGVEVKKVAQGKSGKGQTSKRSAEELGI